MTRAKRLLQRLERHEEAVAKAQAALLEAQEGFLIELGWERTPNTGWTHHDAPNCATLWTALSCARAKIAQEEP
jgi:hypothetical protein